MSVLDLGLQQLQILYYHPAKIHTEWVCNDQEEDLFYFVAYLLWWWSGWWARWWLGYGSFPWQVPHSAPRWEGVPEPSLWARLAWWRSWERPPGLQSRPWACMSGNAEAVSSADSDPWSSPARSDGPHPLGTCASVRTPRKARRTWEARWHCRRWATGHTNDYLQVYLNLFFKKKRGILRVLDRASLAFLQTGRSWSGFPQGPESGWGRSRSSEWWLTRQIRRWTTSTTVSPWPNLLNSPQNKDTRNEKRERKWNRGGCHKWILKCAGCQKDEEEWRRRWSCGRK